MVEHLNRVAEYLARRDIDQVEPAELLLLAGSCLIRPIEIAAESFKRGLADRLMVTGGIGHSTSFLYETVAADPRLETIETKGRPEADIIADILRQLFDIDRGSIIVENQSTNCGANAELSRRKLDALGILPKTLLLIQDPTMQRRTHASCERSWQGTGIEILSYSPFLPKVFETEGQFQVKGEGAGVWPFQRFLSLLQGEIARLRDDENGYGPNGRNFIGHIFIPEDVLESSARIEERFGISGRG